MNDDILTQEETKEHKLEDQDPLFDLTAGDQTVEILFKIPQEAIKDIKLRFDLDFTMEQVKKEIERQHNLKP